MIKIKCPAGKIQDSIIWIKNTAGTAINIGWTSQIPKWEDSDSKYTIAWKSISTNNGGMYLYFKNECDATAYRLKFGL